MRGANAIAVAHARVERRAAPNIQQGTGAINSNRRSQSARQSANGRQATKARVDLLKADWESFTDRTRYKLHKNA